MIHRCLAPCCLVITLTLAGPLAAAEPQLDEHLAPLKPFVSKTWRGEFKRSTGDKPMVDVSQWEVILKGNAVRCRHSVNDGVYGGETIIMWDPEKNALATFYFTTAGFFTEGTMEIKDGKIHSHEKVRGVNPGVAEVQAVTELTDGKMHVKARFLQGGKWVDAHEILYTEAPDAKVVLVKPQNETRPDERSGQDWMKSTLPGEPHTFLGQLSGKWDLTVRLPTGPDGKWSESKGSAEYKSVLGGRFVVEEVKCDLFGQPFEWVGLYGFDNQRKKFTAVWVDNFGTSTEMGEGVADSSGKTITYVGEQHDPRTGGKQKYKWILKISDANNMQIEMIEIDNKGQESKTLEITAARAK